MLQNIIQTNKLTINIAFMLRKEWGMEEPNIKGLLERIKTDKKLQKLVAAVLCSLIVLAVFVPITTAQY